MSAHGKGIPAVGSNAGAPDWRVTAACTTRCTATIKSSSGSVFHLTYAAGRWTGTGGYTFCTDSSGREIAGTRSQGGGKLTVVAPRNAAAKGFAKLHGTLTYTITSNRPGCTFSPGDTWTVSTTLTRY